MDAASLQRWQRDAFRDLAAEVGAPFVIISTTASDATLRGRLAARSRSSNDASEADTAVLDHQQRTQEPLAPDEWASVVALRSGSPGDSQNVFAWRELRARLASS